MDCCVISQWSWYWFIMVLEHWFVFNVDSLAITLKGTAH